MQTRINILNNGQELQILDLNTIAQVASAADDQVWNEFLRITPFGGTATKAIFPHASYGVIGQAATVATNGATGTVAVYPFRAFVGSRTLAATNNALNWTDIRSQFYVGTGSSDQTTVPITANSSGNPRWDLVYAAVAVDAPTSNVTRYVKNPTTKVVSATSLSVSLATTVTVAVVTGTPAATPALPALPADAGGTYYIPLAYIRVANGFSSSTNVGPRDIRDQAPIIPVATTTAATSIRPANGNNDGAATYRADANFQWNASVQGQRPSVFLPPTWVGGEQILVALDLTTAAHPSHAQNSIVDQTVDWRNRLFVTFTCASNTAAKFAFDPTNAATPIPIPNTQGISGSEFQMGQSFFADNALPTTGASVYFATSASLQTFINGSSNVLLYVNMSDGTLRVQWTSGTPPAAKLVCWVMATAQFTNF